MSKKLSSRQQKELMKGILGGSYPPSQPPRQHYQPRPQAQPEHLLEEEVQPDLFEQAEMMDEGIYSPDVRDVPVYSSQPRQRPSSYRQAPPAQYPHRGTAARTKKGSVGGWVLLGVLIVLLLSAAVLLFFIVSGRLAFGSRTKISADNPVLAPTNDAGQAYIDQTLFIGDSNFLRLSNYNLVNPGYVAAQEALGVAGVTDNPFLMVSGQEQPITVEKTVALMQPKRVLLMLGTNDIGISSVDEFIANYRNTLEGLMAASPKTHIVVAGIPLAAQQTSYPDITPQVVGEYNIALQALCGEMGVPFLDTTQALAGPDGYLQPAFAEEDGLHLNQAGLEALLQHYRTHAWKP